MHRNSEKFVIPHTNTPMTVVISMFIIRYKRAVSCYKNSHLIGNINGIAMVKVNGLHLLPSSVVKFRYKYEFKLPIFERHMH